MDNKRRSGFVHTTFSRVRVEVAVKIEQHGKKGASLQKPQHACVCMVTVANIWQEVAGSLQIS